MRKINALFIIFLLVLPGFSLKNTTVDQSSENKEIAKAKNPLEKASLHIKFADKRIHFIQDKWGKGKLKVKGKSEELYSLINEYEDNVDKAYGEISKAQALGLNTNSSLETVNQATSKHLEVLNRVLAKVPNQAKSAIRHAIEVSQRGHQKALENLSKRKIKQEKVGKNKGVGKGKALDKQKPKSHPGKGKKKKVKKHKSL